MTQIEKSINPEAITGFQRIARHESFVILADLNMIQQVRIITQDKDGIPLLERIREDPVLTPAQRQAALLRYQDQIVTKQTDGAFVDKSGVVVPEATPGAIPQKVFFQALTLGHLKAMGVDITDETSVASLLYLLIGNEIGYINGRGDL